MCILVFLLAAWPHCYFHHLLDLALDLLLRQRVEIIRVQLGQLELTASRDCLITHLSQRQLFVGHMLGTLEIVKVESLLEKQVLKKTVAHLTVNHGCARV